MIVAMVFALLGGCKATAPCDRLALPEPALTDARTRQCVAAVLDDELKGGANYSLPVRAGTRDVIVDRRMLEVRETLLRISEMDHRDDPVAIFSVSAALHALTLLRDPDADAMNLRFVNEAAPPALLSSAIGNLAFGGRLDAGDRIAEVFTKLPIDERYMQAMTAALNYLASANHHPERVCGRLSEVSQFLQDCEGACEPGTASVLRESAGRYATGQCSMQGIQP